MGASEFKPGRSRERLPIAQLQRVTQAHVSGAVQALMTGSLSHQFGESTDFDLVAPNGVRLPPKAVFGLAATEALGFQVLPKHFTGGIGTPCFNALEAAGYDIVPKLASAERRDLDQRTVGTRRSSAFSTKAGFVNANDQEVLGPTGLAGTDHGQAIYVLKCHRCGREYGANGSDIAGRRCPGCGGGRPGFEVTAADVIEVVAGPVTSARNPNWTRDELILALEVYFDHPTADQTHPAVQELSLLLNRLWGVDLGQATRRNATGVSMKLGNFQRLDPTYLARGRKGLAHGSHGDQEVWEEFAEDRPRLRATAAAIRAALELTPEIVAVPDNSTDAEAAEGALLTRMHHYRERDASLARKRKEQARGVHGRLSCEACEFDFAEAYGERGEGFIEVHHTKALETLKPGAKTKLSELAILCANCHRMVHAKRPWLTMDELKEIVRKSAEAAST